MFVVAFRLCFGCGAVRVNIVVRVVFSCLFDLAVVALLWCLVSFVGLNFGLGWGCMMALVLLGYYGVYGFG